MTDLDDRAEHIHKLEAAARQWDRNAANVADANYITRGKAAAYRRYATLCREKAERLRNGEDVDESAP